MKENKKGSALLWSLVVIGVLSILIAACLTISYSYYNRALQNNSKRQAYLTAKGVIEDISENIQSNNEEYLALFMDTSKDVYTPIVNEESTINLIVNFGSPSVPIGTIESCTIKINKIDKTMKGYITISVVASYGEQLYEVKADLKLGKKDGSDKWQLIRYYQNGDVDEVKNNITKGTNVGKDFVYYYEYFIYKRAETGKLELAMEALLDLIKQEKSWENVDAKTIAALEGLKSFDDFTFRVYLANRNENHEFEPYDNDEVKDKDKILVPKVVGSEIKKVEVSLVNKGFFKKKYYIQPKYTNSYNLSFVFAYEKSTPANYGTINLVFYDGHWYYIEEIRFGDSEPAKSLVPTSLDNDPNAALKWQYVIDHFLTSDNMLQ